MFAPVILLTWGVWGYAFWRRSHRVDPLRVIAQQCRILRWAGLVIGLGGLLAYLFTQWRWGRLGFVIEYLFTFFFGVLALLFSAGPPLFCWLARRGRCLPLGEAGKGA